ALEAQLAQLRWNLARSRVVAPFAGRVKSRYVERGETVSPSQSAFAVIATGSLEARVAVPMRVLARLDLDAPLVVSFPDRPELARIGRVDHPPVASDERSGSVPLVIDVPNDDGALLPGMLVDVALAVGDPRAPATTELRVPLSAVRVRDEGPVVFRIDDETSTMVAVELGDVRGTEVVVLGGLHAGDVIVDQTPDRLRDGDVVAASR
ncbi:MAG: efflux RND transporter periplasmic adaptor subunit, partial [Candidatus Krumholzibacteriia bacterium]